MADKSPKASKPQAIAAVGPQAAAAAASPADGYRMLARFPDPVLQLSSARDVVWANEAARRMFRPALVGKSLGKFFKSKQLNAAFKRALRGEEPQELALRWGGQNPRDLNLRFTTLSGVTDLGGVVLLSVQDLTAHKALDRARADFVANASHELRTPLTTLLGFIETLLGPAQDDPEALRTFLPIMHNHAQRMARLIDDLLSLSKLEMGSEHPEGSVDLRELLASVAGALSLQAEERGVTLKLKGKHRPLVAGDPHQLEQVFWNIIENALKYGRPKDGRASTVTLEIKKPRPDGSVSIAIRDEGEGIDKKHIARLTERFYRVDKARSRTMGGTGLGLAIVKHIIQRHEGSLKVKSRLGAGTTFFVSLPLARRASAEPDSSPL